MAGLGVVARLLWGPFSKVRGAPLLAMPKHLLKMFGKDFVKIGTCSVVLPSAGTLPVTPTLMAIEADNSMQPLFALEAVFALGSTAVELAAEPGLAAEEWTEEPGAALLWR